MSDEDALLAAIAAHPDEDTPRLMFADWLDEHDRPLRAEFIRLQCATKEPGRLSPGEHKKAARRLDELVRNHRRELIPGPLGETLNALEITFDRGFLSEVRVTALQFVQRPETFGVLRPVPRVRVRHLNGAWFAAFIQRPELTCVASIALATPGPNAALALATCPYLTNLEALDWTTVGHRIGDTGLEALAFADELPRLKSLDVPGNEIGDSGVERLVASPLWRRLKRLNLAHNALTGAGADHLANAPPDQIELLLLHGLNPGSAGARRLARRFGDRVQF